MIHNSHVEQKIKALEEIANQSDDNSQQQHKAAAG